VQYQIGDDELSTTNQMIHNLAFMQFNAFRFIDLLCDDDEKKQTSEKHVNRKDPGLLNPTYNDQIIV